MRSLPSRITQATLYFIYVTFLDYYRLEKKFGKKF